MGRMSRDKGKAWERVVAAKLRAIFGSGVKRGWQARQGSDAPDVEGVPWWVEAKHHRVVNIGQAVRQALAAVKKAKSKLPVLIASRSNRQEPLATMLLEDWLQLVGELANLRAAVDTQVPRVRKAVEMWRAAHPGNEKTWPDLGDLVDWLMKLHSGWPRENAARGALVREALVQVKVDHINKSIQLPISTHAMVENALAGWTCPGHSSRLAPCPGGVFPPAPEPSDGEALGPVLCVPAPTPR